MTVEHEQKKGSATYDPQATDGATQEESPNLEQVARAATPSSPIISVGDPDASAQVTNVTPPLNAFANELGGGEESPTVPGTRKLVPPPKPKVRDSEAPAGRSVPPEGQPRFPAPSTVPVMPSGSSAVRSTGLLPSIGSMRSPSTPPKPQTASLRPSEPPLAAASGVGSVSKVPIAQKSSQALDSSAPTPVSLAISPTTSAFPKSVSFPPPKGNSSPPPTLPTGSRPSQYPWMSSTTAALAEGKLPNAVMSRPTQSVPSVPVPSGPVPSESNKVEPPPPSAPNSAPRAAVLPRATRETTRRSSTPPPKPRFIPQRPQKETPTVAIEAMRIIAIGVEEQLTSPDHSVPETPMPVSDEDFDTRPTDVSERATLPSARASRPDELGIPTDVVVATDKTKQPSLSSITAEQTEATVPTDVETKFDSEPEEVADVVDAAPVPSRRPPPPRRRSLPAVASEPQIAVAEMSTSERELVAAEAGSTAKSEAIRGDGATTEPPESIETVETIEPVEPAEPIQSPNIPTAPALPREGGMPTPPSRVPREPPPRPRAKSDATIETAAPAEAVAPTPPSETSEEKPKARPRRLWWEDLFNEDFSRALVRLSEHQIEQEVTFIEDSLGVAPGAVVLDLGCGSGEHAVELASRGYGVVGYDLSLHQLAVAQETAQERGQKLNFLQGDMREMAFEEVFDGIYCWNTTFGYFEEDKNVNVVERMFQALKPGGTLLLDVINRDFAAGDQPSSVWFEGDSCVCMDDMTIDFLTSRMRVKRSLILDDGRTRECTYSIRLYSLHELGKILHSAGFRVTEASGHPTTPGVFLGQSSPRIIILAQKP